MSASRVIRRSPLLAASGFSLIELFVAMAVVAILLAAALPSFRDLGMRMNVSSTTNDLVGALNTARAEAAKRGTWVAVIANSNTNDWSSGWRVEADVGAPPNPPDHVFSGAAPDVVIQRYGALPPNYAVHTLVTGGNDAQIVFGPAGQLLLPTTEADLNICRPDGQAANSRRIIVGGSGEITSQRDTSTSPAPAC